MPRPGLSTASRREQQLSPTEIYLVAAIEALLAISITIRNHLERTLMARYVAARVPGKLTTSQGAITCPVDGQTTGHQVAGEIGGIAEITCSSGHNVPVPNGVDDRDLLNAVDSADRNSRNRW